MQQTKINDEMKKLYSQMHPQRNTFTFTGKGGIIISSDFESGNLAACEENITNQSQKIFTQVTEESKTDFITPLQDDIFAFNIWLSPDALPYLSQQKQKAFFHFSITGIPNETEVGRRRILKFKLKNTSNQAKLLSYGHRPFFTKLTATQYRTSYVQGQQKVCDFDWQRLKSECQYQKVDDSLELNFEHILSSNTTSQDFICFCYVQPFTLNDIKLSSDSFLSKFSADIFTDRRILCYSYEGRPCEIITVTHNNFEGTQNFQYEYNNYVYPVDKEPPIVIQKPTVFLSSRVHCGETPASFFLQGIYDFLTSNTDQSKLLLQKFVFKIVPCLNPDGVARGYWRVDTNNKNLNRVYSDPDPKLYPTIFAVRHAIVYENLLGNLFAYIDLHGHATKRGCFVFGNSIATQDSNLDQLMLPKLMSLNSVNFDFNECSFNDAENNIKDLKGDSREGSGRAAVFKLTSIPYCYTLEGNYATGIRINTLQPKFLNGKKIIKEEFPVNDTSSEFYKKFKIPLYEREVFQDVGRALMISLLDLTLINNQSRLLKNDTDTLNSALEKIRNDIKRDTERASIKQMKLKQKKLNIQKVEFELVTKEIDEECKIIDN